MSYYCNPMNLKYQYQLFQLSAEEGGLCRVHREAADPSILLFKGVYYLFPSMSAGFYTSEELTHWKYHEFRGEIPIYDYAPDVRVVGEYLYFCASVSGQNASFYRTRDPLTEPFEEIRGTFPFWDPNLFQDDDGRLYLYWGSSNAEPIYGVELDPETMRPAGEKRGLIEAREDRLGYERMGEDYAPPKTEEEIRASVQALIRKYSEEGYVAKGHGADEDMLKKLYRWCGNSPYLEGPWMTKHRGKYYLQYAVTGTEYNVYADGVYVAESPLGPFSPARNNPYSYKPGGFITAAGHGSTFEDRSEGFWHVSTMRISKNHSFERRLGLWRAGFDEDGELVCDQRYGDWPMRTDAGLWEKPDWMLLSYRKAVKVSSGQGAERLVDEDVRTWWQAETAGKEEWAELDLGKVSEVHAVQLNFADDWTVEPAPDTTFFTSWEEHRYLDNGSRTTRWILEGSEDGERYTVLEDKSDAMTDLSHDLLVWEEGKRLRYLRLRAMELPYGQRPCVSGIRVFGLGGGALPVPVEDLQVTWGTEEPLSALDMQVSWEDGGAVGYNILWGYAPEKLYHSYMVYGKTEQKIGALAQGSPVYVRVDAFDENGISQGNVKRAR